MLTEKHSPHFERSWVGFVVGDVSYAVSIGSVKEIVSPANLTVVPHAPDAVIGVADHRGQVVPVVDLRRRFALPPAADHSRRKWIMLNVGGSWVGLAVDRVTEVFGTASSKLGPAPSLGGGEKERGILGVVHHAGELVFVLDVSEIGTIASRATPEASVQSAGAR